MEIDDTRMRMSGVTMPSTLRWRPMPVADLRQAFRFDIID